ncbi:hypothetical protein B0I32_13212 [Nonomuraea fuscirosea]|uniref:Uncharacterized protein n=1 Tax=Nonomuraea fuscirosea TaxID=1291556 RepID=A0A2T0M549_9ACTN|nr:hypothetical protein [Nonomuraea fuscirosea]PRX52262.1 hypothetical protein B0I32_13212 [Nonomuraea fuscirosea]
MNPQNPAIRSYAPFIWFGLAAVLAFVSFSCASSLEPPQAAGATTVVTVTPSAGQAVLTSPPPADPAVVQWPFFQPVGDPADNQDKKRFDILNAMSCERIRKIGEERPDSLRTLYAGLADACESALLVRTDRWQGAEQSLATYKSVGAGPEPTCADKQALRILENLVDAHRQAANQPVKVMRLSAPEPPDCY